MAAAMTISKEKRQAKTVSTLIYIFLVLLRGLLLAAEKLISALGWTDTAREKVYFIGGNHDFIFDGHFSKTDALILNRIANGKLCYLDGFTTIDHLSNDGFIYHIFGTPYCHIFGNWAFMREDDMLKKLYNHIPTECDILFSHDAADMNGLGLQVEIPLRDGPV